MASGVANEGDYDATTQYRLDVSTVMKSCPNSTGVFQTETIQIGKISGYFTFSPMIYTTTGSQSGIDYFVSPDVKHVSNTIYLYIVFKCDTLSTISVVKRLNILWKIGGATMMLWKTNELILSKHIIHMDIKITSQIIKLSSAKPLIADEPSSAFNDELTKWYEMSKQHGETTLVVEIDSAHATSPPPSKKRKLNHNHNDNASETRVKVNSVILRASSKVFDRMLSNNMEEKETKTIRIKAKCVKDVDDMIYFNTTNRLRKDSHVVNMLRLAHLYQMSRLKAACSNRLLKELNVQNFAETVQVFDRLGIYKGYDVLVEFAKNNIHELTTQKNRLMQLSNVFKLEYCFTNDG